MVNRARTIEELIEADVVSPRDWARVESALDFLWTIRNELHFQAGRKDDRLTFHNQERMALFLGYRDKGTVRAVEQFMRDYYLHADAIRHFTNHLFEESLSAISSGTGEIRLNEGFVLSKGGIIRAGDRTAFGIPGEDSQHLQNCSRQQGQNIAFPSARNV